MLSAALSVAADYKVGKLIQCFVSLSHTIALGFFFSVRVLSAQTQNKRQQGSMKVSEKPNSTCTGWRGIVFLFALLFPADLGANILNDRGYFGRLNWVRTSAGETGVGRHVQISQQRAAF